MVNLLSGTKLNKERYLVGVKKSYSRLFGKII